jgi:hypothetical protein
MTIEEKFSCGINLFLPVQSYFQKYFRFRASQITSRTLAIPPHKGRIAIVTDAGWDAVDAAALGAQRDGRAGSYEPVSDQTAG